jgi:glycosyltransferase involved in cell wall biosynthesis
VERHLSVTRGGGVAQILYLTNVLPYPLDSGPKIRAYYVLRHLAPRHEVTLVSFVREDDHPSHVMHLREVCREVHTVRMQRSRVRDARALLVSVLSGQPALVLRDEVGAMHALLGRLVREGSFDVVHADQTSMAQYALRARAQAGGSMRTVLDAHNALYRIPERMAARARNPVMRGLLRREARLMARYERETYARFDHVVFVTDVDRQVLGRQMAQQVPQSTIPICIDPQAEPLVARVPRPGAITHLGTMFWPPNVEGVLWFGREVLPRVRAEVPEARFVVIGKQPPPAVQALATGDAAAGGVTVTGYVDDPTPYLADTAAFIVPLHAGGGMRVKIVDAWRWGMPVVSTTIGAEGIDVRDGENILVADTAEAFAGAVIRLLQEPALGERLRSDGRHWVEEHYDWRTVYARWDGVYEQLLKRS